MIIKLNAKGVLDSVDYVSSLLRSGNIVNKSRAIKSAVLHHLDDDAIRKVTLYKGEVSNTVALYISVLPGGMFLSLRAKVDGKNAVLCNADSFAAHKLAKHADLSKLKPNLIGNCLVYLVYCRLVQLDNDAAANTTYFRDKAFALVSDLNPLFRNEEKLQKFLGTYEPADNVFRVDLDVSRRWLYITFVSANPPARKRNPLIVPLRQVVAYMADAKLLESLHDESLDDPSAQYQPE